MPLIIGGCIAFAFIWASSFAWSIWSATLIPGFVTFIVMWIVTQED